MGYSKHISKYYFPNPKMWIYKIYQKCTIIRRCSKIILGFFWFFVVARISARVKLTTLSCTVFCTTFGYYDIFHHWNIVYMTHAFLWTPSSFSKGFSKRVKFDITLYNGCVEHWTLHNDTEMFAYYLL